MWYWDHKASKTEPYEEARVFRRSWFYYKIVEFYSLYSKYFCKSSRKFRDVLGGLEKFSRCTYDLLELNLSHTTSSSDFTILLLKTLKILKT
jgi:hypothetical protein